MADLEVQDVQEEDHRQSKSRKRDEMSSAAAAGFNKRDFVSSGAPEDPDVAAAARDASISRGRLPLPNQNFSPFMQIKFDNLVPIHKCVPKPNRIQIRQID